jgi:hypothetical protein
MINWKSFLRYHFGGYNYILIDILKSFNRDIPEWLCESHSKKYGLENQFYQDHITKGISFS